METRRQSESGKEVFNDERVVLVMVGLPARLGVRANIFNVGSLRRKVTTDKQSCDFFDAQNVAAKQQREELACAALDMALEWLGGGGEVAIFDATNTTNDRRVEVINRCHRFSSDIKVVFLESICNDAQVLDTNFMQKVTNSPDYKDMDLEDAMADLRKRIEKYESVYEPLDNDELSYVKLINMQSKVICNHIYGNMAHMLVPFLMSVHIIDRPIYLCRPAHFETEGDSSQSYRELKSLVDGISAMKLSDLGEKFVRHLKEAFNNDLSSTNDASLKDLRVYTRYSSQSDPLNYRLHGGESLGDLIRRLSSFVIELERQRKPTVVVSHLLNLEVLYGYLLGRRLSETFESNIPLHVVVKLVPTQYGWKEERFDLRDAIAASTTPNASSSKTDPQLVYRASDQ
ncbi:putative 6phosphofructo2kinase/fructose2, partial [Globisporangium splendens]